MSFKEKGTLPGGNSTRRRFLAQTGTTGGVLAAATLVGGAFTEVFAQGPNGVDQTSGDTPEQIFTAALIAEDLASTFYYNGLVGAASAGFHSDDRAYLGAALSEEITHANLFRSLLGGSSAASDPVQTFYFPAGAFTDPSTFLTILDALERAFIGAYLAAVQEFARMAAETRSQAANHTNASRIAYSAGQFEYFAKVAASILGVEAEHRVLGRVIAEATPPNNFCFEQTDNIATVFNGPNSAVAALQPFLTSSTGTGASLAEALANQASVSVACSGGPPAP